MYTYMKLTHAGSEMWDTKLGYARQALLMVALHVGSLSETTAG